MAGEQWTLCYHHPICDSIGDDGADLRVSLLKGTQSFQGNWQLGWSRGVYPN